MSAGRRQEAAGKFVPRAGKSAWCRALGLSAYGGDEVLLLTLVCGTVALVLWWSAPWWAMGFPLAAWLFFLYFFRDPPRAVIRDGTALLSPADGKVADIGEVEEPVFVGGRALRIGIFLSGFDVHVNRSPCDGLVRHLSYQPGKFRAAFHRKAAQENEKTQVGLEHEPRGVKILLTQIAGVLARRVVCDLQTGQRVAQGERFGMIKFGSRTELYVPLSGGFAPSVQVGETVRGGLTVVGRWSPGPPQKG